MNAFTPVRRGLGINAGLDAGLARELAVTCERLGYHSLWSNDDRAAAGLDTLALFAAAGPRLVLGVGFFPSTAISRLRSQQRSRASGWIRRSSGSGSDLDS